MIGIVNADNVSKKCLMERQKLLKVIRNVFLTVKVKR